MATTPTGYGTAEPVLDPLEKIKRLAVVAMFSDEELFDQLVLKGGNAMNLVHQLSSRASLDLDFSMQHDFPEGIERLKERVERTLSKTFQQEGYAVFDLKLEEQPGKISADLAHFWGGYALEFKLIDLEAFEKYRADLEALRMNAINVGNRKKFLIDISRFEYTTGKREAELDGYRIYVYSPEMIVCEKLRAICQQMEEYGPIVRRSRQAASRARDFFDIHVLVEVLRLDIAAPENQTVISEMFKAKKVPIGL